jgi:hypothetical protein
LCDDAHRVWRLQGAESLARAVADNVVLELLDLQHNELGSAGAAAFADSLWVNQHLKML